MDKQRIIEELQNMIDTLKMDMRQDFKAIWIRISDHGYKFPKQVYRENPIIDTDGAGDN